MLREGWDVRNVTTIVPLRPLTAKSKILPEQTLGRGLRRMTPPGEESVAETVTVVEHTSFLTLYEDELAERAPARDSRRREGPAHDRQHLPRRREQGPRGPRSRDPAAFSRLSGSTRTSADLDFEDVREAFSNLEPLPLGEPQEKEINYEGRHLITDELVEQMKIKLPLLSDPIGAISFYREELERAVKIKGTHQRLAPLLQRFIEEVLFEEAVDLYDERVVGRLADSDVRTYIRATFVPLLRKKVTRHQERLAEEPPQSVTALEALPGDPFRDASGPDRRATPFNLAPCNRQLEVAMTHFLDRAEDVAAFAKNQGPQCLRIDCLNAEGRRRRSTRPTSWSGAPTATTSLPRRKAARDPDVAGKARAAVEWCKAALDSKVKWEYLYVLKTYFKDVRGDSLDELIRTCRPALKKLLEEAESSQIALPLGHSEAKSRPRSSTTSSPKNSLELLPLRAQQGHPGGRPPLRLHGEKQKVSFSPVFQPLLGPLDAAAEGLLFERLEPALPEDAEDRAAFFAPDLERREEEAPGVPGESGLASKRLLVHRSPIMPVGILRFCLDYAKKEDAAPAACSAPYAPPLETWRRPTLRINSLRFTSSGTPTSRTSKGISRTDSKQRLSCESGSRRLSTFRLCRKRHRGGLIDN